MKLKRPYECIRCGYITEDKFLMRRHLYDRKKVCPGQVNKIEMTDEIRECILENKVYIIEKQIPQPTTTQIINQTINNYQQINNVVNSMDSVEKITKVSEYKNIDILDFEENVEQKYHMLLKRLENGKDSNFSLNYDNIMQMLDNLTCTTNIQDLNVLYDQCSNKLKIFNDGEWHSMIFDIGVKEIIEIVKYIFLDHYECYLCRQIYDETNSYLQRTKKKEYLSEYYKLLICFEFYPFVKGKTDNKILYQRTDPKYHTNNDEIDSFSQYKIEEEVMKLYVNIKDNIKLSEVNKLKRDIHTLIKKNSKSNILELNKRMMEIIKVDETFKMQVINHYIAS